MPKAPAQTIGNRVGSDKESPGSAREQCRGLRGGQGLLGFQRPHGRWKPSSMPSTWGLSPVENYADLDRRVGMKGSITGGVGSRQKLLMQVEPKKRTLPWTLCRI